MDVYASVSENKVSQIEKRRSRVPQPPPRCSRSNVVGSEDNVTAGVPPGSTAPPPPPPPPPSSSSIPKGAGSWGVGIRDKVHRAPELMELYRTLMKREVEKSTTNLISSISDARAESTTNLISSISNARASGDPSLPTPPVGGVAKGAEVGDKAGRAPTLIEFYNNFMKQETKKYSTTLISSTSDTTAANPTPLSAPEGPPPPPSPPPGVRAIAEQIAEKIQLIYTRGCPFSSTINATDNMIGEFSPFLLKVKDLVETEGDFFESLAAEVRVATFTDIQDLVAFLRWLDEELSFLYDEGEETVETVLEHFNWPVRKVDALRGAASEYEDLLMLEKQVSEYEDDPTIPCEKALKMMYARLEKVEKKVYALFRTNRMPFSQYKRFGISVNWLETEVVEKLKMSSIQLAKKYMKRVVTQPYPKKSPKWGSYREPFLDQAIGFAYRVHQLAGGFDSECTKAFEELRNRVNTEWAET